MDPFLLCMFRVCHAVCLFIAALCAPAEKVLTFWLLCVMFSCAFVTFPCGVLGQVWYFIVSTPDLCLLSYFHLIRIRVHVV